VNRRNNPEPKVPELRAAGQLKGPTDHDVPLLAARGSQGQWKDIVLGYACHGTVLDHYAWCGDNPGFATMELEHRFPGSVALFFAGCDADQNPLPRSSVALAEKYGKDLAAAVACALSGPMQTLDPVLRTAYTEVELPLCPPPTREQLAAYARDADSYHKKAAEELIAQLDAGKPLRTTYPYPVQCWRLGNKNIVVLGGEIVVDYAILAKKLLGHDTFVMGYSNDMMSYIPSVRVLKEGGYEGETAQILYGMPAKWQDDIEQRILDALKELAAGLGALVP